jgi:hypothetical protein
MSQLKRFPIKYIRDYIKKDYKLKDKCYICGSEEKLELHHLYSVSQLFKQWCSENKVTEIDTVEKITSLREIFAVDCRESLDHHNLYTLCKTHHQRLHNIYGQNYSNHLVPKIKNWLEIQKDKNG